MSTVPPLPARSERYEGSWLNADARSLTVLALRLRTLADVFAYAQAEGIELRLDTTEIQIRQPAAGRGECRAFVSGKKKQNTMKATVVAHHQSRTL